MAKKKKMPRRDEFRYGDQVVVRDPKMLSGRKRVVGHVYCIEQQAGKERVIYVMHSCGTAHLVRYVRHTKKAKGR